MLILNEEKYAQDLHDGKHDELKSIVAKIGYITRYFHYTLGLDKIDNYKRTVEWLKCNHGNFEESVYSNVIADSIKRAQKRPFYHIDSINITYNELNTISSLNDLRAEKMLFVLLCMAKQQAASFGFKDGLVKYSLAELCKMARISVPTEDREYVLYYIKQAGLLRCPHKNNTKCLIVNFIDHSGEIALRLTENHCNELAYEYLNWKNNGQGYSRCELCDKAIKQSKSNPKRFCRDCAAMIGDISDDMKIIQCVDCGDLVEVPILNTKTCRCEECQGKIDIELNRIASRERMRRYRENH